MPTYVVTVQEPNWACTGSVYPSAITSKAQFLTSDVSTVINTGSWPGLANTWGGNSTISGSFDVTVEPGLWGGLDNTYGVRTLPTESIDRFTLTSDDNPSVNQGIGTGEWDPFPIPPDEPEPEAKQRDVTRYRKAYSSQRHQPQRIRYIQRRTRT